MTAEPWAMTWCRRFIWEVITGARMKRKETETRKSVFADFL
jgi:hypothetical protein